MVGVPGHELLALTDLNEHAHMAVLSGYCMARDANVGEAVGNWTA